MVPVTHKWKREVGHFTPTRCFFLNRWEEKKIQERQRGAVLVTNLVLSSLPCTSRVHGWLIALFSRVIPALLSFLTLSMVPHLKKPKCQTNLEDEVQPRGEVFIYWHCWETAANSYETVSQRRTLLFLWPHSFSTCISFYAFLLFLHYMYCHIGKHTTYSWTLQAEGLHKKLQQAILHELRTRATTQLRRQKYFLGVEWKLLKPSTAAIVRLLTLRYAPLWFPFLFKTTSKQHFAQSVTTNQQYTHFFGGVYASVFIAFKVFICHNPSL